MGMYRSTITGTQGTQTIDVVMGWSTLTTTSVANATTLATNVWTAWSSYILPTLVDDYVIHDCVVVGMDNTTVTASFNTGASPGGSTAQPLPEFVCANVKLATGVRGRSYQGRYGIPGLFAACLEPTDGNLLNSTMLGILQTNVSNFHNAVNGSFGTSSQMAVISTISGGTPRTTPIATPITTATVQLALGSRVSRKS